ncbi:mitogen-activated protein kinase kinase kinase 17-like [Carica papaya]|uniref:mitogen-activated protein kinase kinase kinase 17-like n=1 Tax=Carica papaya TaxID=3649 RepID=UPI000B8C6FBD|nr:mitogen-activated protein kinase kinase kinase 17-like [Carica papaya]
MSDKLSQIGTKRKSIPPGAETLKMVVVTELDQDSAVKKIRLLKKIPIDDDHYKNCKCNDTMNDVSWVRHRLLGKRGYGFVFSARTMKPNPDNLPPQVTIKCTKMHRVCTLIHEKNIISSLTTSPHVIKYYGYEVCKGSGLSDMEVRVYTKDILIGLKHVHGENIIHCDIKPENILLNRDELVRKESYVAKLADFGLAVDRKSGNEPRSRQGTRFYMSLELVRKKMMTGKRVWSSKGNTEEGEVMRVIAESSPMGEVPGYVSDDGRDFLKKCFAPNPAKRWSADQLIHHSFLDVIPPEVI